MKLILLSVSLGSRRWLATIVAAATVALSTGECVTAAVLADYSFTTIVPTSTNPDQIFDQSSADIDPNSTATDVASPRKYISSTNGNPATSLSLSGTAWTAVGEIGPTSHPPTIGATDFIVFNVAPNAGQQLGLQSLRFDLRRNDATSIGSYALYADEAPAAKGNNFTTKLGGGTLASVGSWETAQIDLSGRSFLQNVRTPTTFRLYLYGETASGLSQLDNLVLEGSTAAAAPDPTPVPPAGHLSQYAVARAPVPGAPKYEDVVFSSRWTHPTSTTTDPHDTYRAIAEFQPTHLVWATPGTGSGSGNYNYVKSIQSSGMTYGGYFSAQSRDTPFTFASLLGRDRNLDGSLNGGTSQPRGDVTGQTFRDIILSHLKFQLDNGARTFQIDDPGLTYDQAVNFQGGYGDETIPKFAAYLSSHGFAGQHGLPSNLTGFDYRNWVNNNQGGNDSTPVRAAFLNFHKEQLQEFYTYIKTEINNYAGHYVPFSVNNTSVNVQTGIPYNYDEVDFWIGETSERFGQLITNGPQGVYNKVKGAEAQGTRQVFSPPNDSVSYGTITTDAQYLRVSRQLFAAAYASGSVALIPWDVWRREDPRYFATFAQFGDLTQLVGENQELFQDHEQVFAVGSGLSPQFAAGLSTEPIQLVGEPNSNFLATVRAAPGGNDAVVHLVDWNDTTSGFSIDLHNTLFGWPMDTPITAQLLLPNVAGTVEQMLTGTLNIEPGYTRFSIPAISPYVLLAVAALATIPGDYNNDGTVNAADYVVWRDRTGAGAPLPNDPLGGAIGVEQYNQWKANFGRTAGSGNGSAESTVLEPATVALLLVGLAGLACRRYNLGHSVNGNLKILQRILIDRFARSNHIMCMHFACSVSILSDRVAR
ncbi:MAG: hypothetical protein WD851_07605 [Pirellulales bacterium]